MNVDPRTVHAMTAQQFGTPRPDAAQFQSGQFASGQFRTQGFAGQQYPGSVPPPPSRPTRKPRPMAAKIIAGLVAAGLVVGGAGTWMALSGSPAEAAVQTTSFAGANPTTSPFGTDAPQVAAVAATGPQTGDTTGLYAATTPPSCNNADFLAQLQSDPAKLAAFGGVFGIGAGDVPAFVDSLAPVVLRANTAVTDHPFADGAFTEQPAILAAGTAVLVNPYGEPTVKCFNGNPLTAGAQAADAVTVVPTTQVIARYSFTTIDNSRVVVIPGKPDTKPIPGPNPTTTPQPDPELVKKAEETKALADQARTEATAARQKADTATAAATRAQADLAGAQADLNQAIKDGNPAVIAELTKVRDAAKDDADTKANQAKYAESAARSAEGTADQAEKNAKDAQDKADASAKTPAGTKDDKDATEPNKNEKAVDPAAKVDPAQTVTGQEGQAPANTSIPCGAIADAATTDCTVPAGSADTATGPTSTGGESTSTGTSSKDSGSAGSSSSSSSSTGGSQSGSKEGSDK
jgi:hypothetical protein